VRETPPNLPRLEQPRLVLPHLVNSTKNGRLDDISAVGRVKIPPFRNIRHHQKAKSQRVLSIEIGNHEQKMRPEAERR